MVARGAGIERRGGRIVDVLVLANAYAAGKSQVQSVSLVGANTPSVTYAYDGNGNVVTRTATDPALSLTIGYDIDNHALTIRRPASGTGQATDNGSTFRYGPDGQRYFQELRQPGQSSRQLIYLGKDYEKEYTGAGQVERWYLPGGAVRIRSTDAAVASGTYFIHGDRLGSTSVMTDRNGQVIGEERRAFDAFGRPRAWDNWNVTEGANATPARNTTLFGPRNRRGFTQHEHVDRTNIIHMNGRIFDAELGRFYGVDPFVQFPSNSQSLNPYSYVLNNPMAGMDPTGYETEAVRSGCDAMTGSRICGVDTGARGGVTSQTWTVRDKDGGVARITESKGSFGERSFSGSWRSGNGAKITQGTRPRSGAGPSELDQVRSEASQINDGLRIGLSDVKDAAYAVDATATVLLPQDGTDVAISVLVPVGARAIRGGARAAKNLTMRQLARRLGLEEGEIDALLGSYRDVRGHHIHAKAAFRGSMNYDPASGFSISQDAMESLGWDHVAMTRYQRQAFDALARAGLPNTMQAQSVIAADALVAGGASREQARALVAESLQQLRAAGVRTPTSIPWNR